MHEVKFWIVPLIVFGIFSLFVVGILFYAYSDLDIASFSQSESNSSVMSMQDFQEAMGSKLK